MSKKLIENYTFNAASNTIVFNDYTSIRLEGLLMITNISDNAKPVLYQFNTEGLTASVTGNVVVLSYNTALMNDNDILQIFYDDIGDNNRSSEEALLLRRLIKIMESNATVDALNRQRIAVEIMPTTAVSGSLTTAGTVSSLVTIAGVDPRFQMIDWARTAYNTMRNNITFN